MFMIGIRVGDSRLGSRFWIHVWDSDLGFRFGILDLYAVRDSGLAFRFGVQV